MDLILTVFDVLFVLILSFIVAIFTQMPNNEDRIIPEKITAGYITDVFALLLLFFTLLIIFVIQMNFMLVSGDVALLMFFIL
jgi:hypothetical protein